jgi:serine/threonine-protein kinase
MPESRQGAGVGDPRIDPSASPKAETQGPDPLIGRVVNGRFKIVSVIARGGMGKVYRAEQAPLGRICALKVLSPKYEGDRDPEFHKRFFLEAATAAKLTHANTVTIFDYGKADDDELYYIAMEYIEGRTLHRVLREESPFNEERVRHVASQICRSLREAHAMGVVHRDLKPGNIMLTDKGDERDSVKVLDFGLVKDVTGEAEDLTQAGLFMGSPKYMAPEQILGGEISPRTDIYSLGVMIFEMLCGKVPFDRGASVGTLMAHVNDAVPAFTVFAPNVQVTPGMDSVVRKCLEKDPAKRYPSMKELLMALKRAGGEAMTETSDALPAAIQPNRNILTPVPPADSSVPAAPPSQPRRGSETEIQVSSQPPGPAPPMDTDSLFRNRRPAQSRRKAYIWGITVGAVAAVGVALAIGKPHGGDNTTGGAPTSTASENGGPGTTATATVTSVPTPTQTPSAAAPLGPRTVHFESDPPGASVSESGTELCPSTPCDVVFKTDSDSHKLSISKKGYKTQKQTVSPTDSKVSVKLDLAAIVGVPGGKPNGYKPDPYK